MSANSQSQETRSEQSAEQRRRRRRERAAKSRTPDPKNIVSGAGQPLDPGVRRELEERLGHDLGRVRLHTGRDAGQLTELLGADAVAVGQDVFFREGAFKPGTDEGRRLLAHELLHTVQNPHGLGALRAGRELGAVSLPQQAIEREAESAAQDVVRADEPATPTAPAPEVEEGQATPGWLRYATVDADRNRTEAIDPATLVDRLANSLVRSLRGDPEDLSKRTRKQLARLPDELLDGVLARLESRLLGSEHDRVLDFVDEIDAYDTYAEEGLERDAHEAPRIEPDTAEELRTERDDERMAAQERQAEEQRPGPAPGPEKGSAVEEGALGSTPQNGGMRPQGGGAGGVGGASAAPEPQTEEASPSSSSSSSSPSSSAAGGQQGGEQKSADSKSEKSDRSEKADKADGGEEETQQEETPAASEEESAAENRPGAAEDRADGRQLKEEDKQGQQGPTGSPTASGKDPQLPGARSTLDGMRDQDLDGPEEAEEEPFGSGSESEVEVGGEEPSAWDVKLQPEDFVPQQDLDVSGVPTADKLAPSSSATPAAPSFPAAPPTKADQVQAERDAEDAEDAAAETEPEGESADVSEDMEPSAKETEETEGGPENGDGPGGLAVEQAAAAPAVPGEASKDPKRGDDPKAGPVTAQTTVQQAPGKEEGKSEGGSEAEETAAKEEKGTAAAGDSASAAPEKGSQQATGGQSAQTDAGAKEPEGGTGGGVAGTEPQSAEPAAEEPAAANGNGPAGQGGSDTPAPSGGSETSGSSGGASGSTSSSTSGTETTAESPAPAPRPEPKARTETPAPTAKSAPAPAPTPSEPAPSPKAAPEPKPAPESAPAPKAAAPRGGGGPAAAPARGKGPKGKKDTGPAPNLSGVSPESGLATASELKPHKALQAMGGVGGAVDRTVGDEHKTLAAAPPSMERPAGAPQTLQGKPQADAPAEYAHDPAQEAQEPEAEDAEVTGEKEPEGEIEAEQAEEPSGWDTFKMALGFGLGKVAGWLGFEVDAQELAAKFAGLPTKDEALKQAQAGNAPGVEMQGDAEQTAGEQDGHVDAKGQETVATARDDSGRAMGENQIYPNAPKEQLTAQVPGQQGGGEGAGPEGAGATGAVPPEAASEVAEHEQGPQFQAAFSEGEKGVSEGRQTKDRDFRDSQAKHKRKVDAEVAAGTEAQTGEREKAMADVTSQREDWRTEQDEELGKLGDKKSERHDKVRQDVEDEEKKTDDNVEKEKEGSDKKIKDESDKAEREAEQKKDSSVEESGNWVTKAFDWIKQKVIEIKDAIVRVIRAARDAVVGFIRNFKETVERWINEARTAIVDAIKNFINDLIEFAKAMVRAIVDLANRIRKLITDLIAAAIALVNRLAAALKQAITDLLDAIGKLLSSVLDALKKALQAAIKAVVAAVKAVLEFASKLLSALGQWMLIAVDFLSDPGGWLGGAKNSAVDGAKNHLFREVSAAVKTWFQEKIQEIIGVPKATIDKLIKGSYTLDKIVKEAWDAVVPQLPLIIGELVITKVVAKLIPGAGWVMAVIDAIRTAWGALSAILSSLGAVLDWLKAVRMGGAGILFAKAVAAGVVALLEVLYQALLSGIGKYVAKVGRRLKDVAAKLGRGKDKDDGKGPGATGSDDKGDTKDRTQSQPQQQTTGAPTTAPTGPRTGTQPRPGTDRPRPTGPTAGRPPAGPGRTDGRDRPQPGRPDTRKDTRPTTPARPRPDQDTRRRDDRPTPAHPRDNRDSSRPRNTDRADDRRRPDQDPNRPKDEDPAKPKGDKDSSGRPKDGSKPKDGRDGDGKKPKDKDKDRDRDRKPKGKDSRKKQEKKEREKRKQEKRDQRKKDEESKESKDERLRKIVAKIRPKLNSMLGRGTGRPVMRAALATMRLWYRLTSLTAGEGDRFDIEASLNPKEKVLDALGITIPRRELLEFLQDVAARLESDPNMVALSQNVQLQPKQPGVVPQHTVNAPTPPPAVTRITRKATPLGPQEQEVMSFFDEGQQIPAPSSPALPPPALRRQQTGPKAANKIVTGEGISQEQQSAHAYKTSNKKDRETGERKTVLGIADEFSENDEWNEAVDYLDNHFRGKPQSSNLEKVQRVNLLKDAWIVGNQEADRDPMALVSNALVVQRLTRAKQNGASPTQLTKIFLDIPAAFKGSEKAGELLNEDVAGQRSLDADRASIAQRLTDETNDDARRRRNRERRPLNAANNLANRHVDSVSRWIKDFGIEKEVEASVNAAKLVGTEERERAIKQELFNRIEDAVREMYGATARQEPYRARGDRS
ncbi:eCIS core domain-containing protein [Streptomyces sp. NPDC002845]